jgi:hypothetical protein
MLASSVKQLLDFGRRLRRTTKIMLHTTNHRHCGKLAYLRR